MKRTCDHLCPMFQTAMDVLAKPWNGLVIATLEGGPLRFSEIGDRLTAIGDRMLSLRLKELEALGLVSRTVIPGPPLRVEYALTAVGHGFRKVADAIGAWGATLTAAPRTECEGLAEVDKPKAS
ncbi:MAG: helix-turn-helix domain-containing protein [Polyangiaceae bacterium]